MILSFKPQFVDPILNGTKIHTIREDSTDRWKAGNSIQCATGVRSKNYNCFLESECVSVQSFEIKYYDKKTFDVFVDGKSIPLRDFKSLYLNDGFRTYSEFLEWFSSDFKGKIIHWTDFRY
ncbi:MAG TPA: hypothetical protein DCL80_15385 [Balneola sp.]|nr:hypothetical protein [Balneola sp.]MAO78907.1 hypothetical protein [Balneola sp.]MBF63566.1 hypothetical protein [Balneola sp.]HAH52556.1 hypothetical protein [Balneola sp.]HAW81397.1 hypothetical protein [Balneola sp.]